MNVRKLTASLLAGAAVLGALGAVGTAGNSWKKPTATISTAAPLACCGGIVGEGVK